MGINRALKLSFIFGFVFLVIGFTSVFLTDTIIRGIIKQKIKLVPSTELYDNWLNIPVDVYMSFYLFDLKNANEFENNGTKPIFAEIGPFVYKETRIRENITRNDNMTISYTERRQYHFVPELSAYNESYEITTLNLATITSINYVKYKPKIEQIALNYLFRLTGEGLVIRKPAGQLLFGYDDPLLDLMLKFNKNALPSAKISLYLNKNDTVDGMYTIFTGEDDYNKIGIINRYNGLDKLNIWTSNWANMINGTDSTLYFPFMKKTSTPYTFQPDVCRSFYTVFNETKRTLNNIEIYGYIQDEFSYANASVNPFNKGFCTPAENCLTAGLFNITSCIQLGAFNAPIYMSLPHFLFGDQKLIEDAGGLKPDFDSHKSIIYVEPLTGIPMAGHKRAQMSAKLERNPHLPLTQKLPEIYFPIFWLDEHFDINQQSADKMYYMMQLPLLAFNVVKIVMMATGVLLLLISTIKLAYDEYKFRFYSRLESSGDHQQQENGEREPLIN